MKTTRTAKYIGMAAVTVIVTISALGWPSPEPKPSTCPNPTIRVFKREAVLELWCNGQLQTKMDATFGASPVGHKEREGDERTPEGQYRISSKVENARFHRFLGISYPNEEDLQRAKRKGILSPGGGIGIHGTTRKLAPLARAWLKIGRATGLSSITGPTDGCIGVSNEDVERLYSVVPIGTPIAIFAQRPEKKQ
ncbi:MAG TPA: L,D-transpeptidase family protein [Polyangium sp.]|nr:L,D-transpeptidase family protein [Polyangium sp.]